ncbi:possible N-acyl homoserine lactonase (plasmid) [Rhodococcus jostii RHA1]|uniref:Possible N-acyl homoserine lactonase n=1 Tax=Rhodococcus jostii (strain RHA1) TaxID=101510 RepID=Q0RVI6_RHOJR|nr:N-acyl homoserine lactonase family protein [Rhodococcus jostii]ABH00700.1 possible N-acyl homoserine lactonase [Rhodococcus jostii RHA1]
MGNKLSGLNLGYVTVHEQSLLNNVPEYVGESYCTPAIAYIIDTPEGRILWETGFSERALDEWPTEWLDVVDLSKLTPEMCIESSLRARGLGPEDFRYVIQAHLHSDHAGGLRVFEEAGVEILVHEDEYNFVTSLAGDESFYCRADWEFLDRKKPTLLSGSEIEIAHGVTVMHSPGHTPGQLSMRLDLPSTGSVLLTSDALYTHESCPGKSEPQMGWDTEQWRDSARDLIEVAKKHESLLFPGHDETGIRFYGERRELVEIAFDENQTYA